MPFIYFILLIIALIKWLFPFIIICTIAYVVAIILTKLYKQFKSPKNEYDNKSTNESYPQKLDNDKCNSHSDIIIVQQQDKEIPNEKDENRENKDNEIQDKKIQDLVETLIKSEVPIKYKLVYHLQALRLKHKKGKDTYKSDLFNYIILSANESIRLAPNDTIKKEYEIIIQVVELLINEVNVEDILRSISSPPETCIKKESIEPKNNHIETSNKTIENHYSEDSPHKTNDDRCKEKQNPHHNSLIISQIISGLLKHAIQQENTNIHKRQLELQILSREQAHLLHSTGQLNKEIDFIKKEIEACDSESSFYRYWTLLLKKRMLEYENKQKSCTHSLFISQIITGLLNHATKQEKQNENLNKIYCLEHLSSTTTNEKNQINSIENDRHEQPFIDLDNLQKENGSYLIKKVPYWEHTYVYSAEYLQRASQEQKHFYYYFKEEFLKGHYLDIENNSNYVFILMFDLCKDYSKHKNYDLLKYQLDILAANYPITARYTSKTLSNSVAAINQEEIKNTSKYDNKTRDQLCRWITSEETIEVQGIKLTRGNFYIGECFLLPDYIIQENKIYNRYSGKYIYGSVLNPNLPVIKNEETHKYIFHTYNDMSLSSRYEYLMWLSGEKTPSEISTEILLFYLYGYEIRMFIDPQTKELERWRMLIDIVQLYRSLNLKPHFHEEELLLQKINVFIINTITKYFRNQKYNLKSIKSIDLPIYQDIFILYKITAENTLSAEDAFDIAYAIYDTEHLIPEKYRIITRQYFINRFTNTFKNYTLKTRIERVDICYYNNNCRFKSEDVSLYYQINSFRSDLSTLKDTIWIYYQRIKSKFQLYNNEKKRLGGHETIAVTLLLPQDFNITEIPEIQTVIARINDEMKNKYFLIKPIKWLLDLFEIKYQNAKSLYIYYVDTIINGLHRMGFGIVPNYTIDIKRFNFEDICVIYKNNEDYPIKRTSKYEKSELFIKLASYVVLMDKALEEDISFVEQQILSNENTAGNQLHLIASIRWRFLSKKRSIDKSIKNAIEVLTNEQRTLMGKALIRLACIDGDVHPKRIDGLKKILPLLGMEVNNIHSQIHRILTDEDGFAIIEKKSDAVEFTINAETPQDKHDISSNIILNSEKLHIFEQQTKKAQELLSEIFTDKENPVSQNIMNNLKTDKWKDILRLLLSKEVWERKEIDNKCKEEGLILGAVLEQINDFAYDKVEDAVVEDDGEYLYVTLDYKENLI